ncbi:MAG: cytochrome c3 family protein [Gemmatimonadota bacterium]|nr:MAG: cytochrome c3 family protein [Gemmatimonadota bacterium]
MPSHRGTLALGLISIAGLAAAVLALQAQRPRPSLSVALAAQATQFSLDPDTLVGWGDGPVQPIFFSHRRHAGEYEIDCYYCHSNTDMSSWASMPPVELCLGCHRVIKAASPEIAKLRGYAERDEPIPWERIYKVADFVQFNHGRHMRAEVQCEECHGKVEEFDVVYQWAPLTMGWCLECHKKPQEDEGKLQSAATNAARFAQPGPESRGLYPKSIDSQYGVLNGPIDCAACHY